MENEQALIEAINRNNELIARRLMFDKDWKIPIRNGVLAGFGGVVGATLVVSLVVWILQPFSTFAPLKNTLDRLSNAIEKTAKEP